MRSSPRAAVRVAAVLLGLVAAAAPARAFDTQPHFDMTRDALAAEGFSGTALQVAQVANWFNDLYENAGKTPYSGHAPWYVNLISNSYGNREDWSQAVRTAAARAHFDSDTNMPDTAGTEREWTRLARATRAALADRAGNTDVEGILTILGITLHMVQDFYTHTNWVEPFVDRSYFRGGPGWVGLRRYGSHPTWFDVPPAERGQHRIYSHGPRQHGSWRSDNNNNLINAMNKDWAGRPLHQDAYITAYVASRQWVRAVRAWLNNEALWSRVRAFSNRHGADLNHDLNGCFRISYYSGHWNGNGEPALASDPGPGGSLLDLRGAIRDYFEPSGLSITGSTKTFFRRKWEDVILLMDARTPPAVEFPVLSSLPIRDAVEFVVVEITKIHEVDDRDLGSADEADWYSTATIAGQEYRSGFINGEDDFNFLQKPYGPFTYIKAVLKSTTPVPITLALFDEDGFLRGDDDHCDISPVRGRKDLRLSYNRATGALSGDVSATGGATVRGSSSDGDEAEISFRVTTLRLAPPVDVPRIRVSVTFQSVRLVDTTRPGQSGKLYFGFSVNGGARRYPAAGALDAALGSPIALPAGTQITLEVRPDEPLSVMVSGVDESRRVTLQAPGVPGIGLERRIAPGGPLGGPGGGTTVTIPLTVSAHQSYGPEQNYGISPQLYTVRGNTVFGAYLEVVYRIGAARVFPIRPEILRPGVLVPSEPAPPARPFPTVPRAPGGGPILRRVP